MRQIILPGTGLRVSRFGFGTASLFSAGGGPQRRDLLAAAYDHGFTHFDTAPYYGFGTAERDLQPLLAAHPEITVATKVGLYSPGGEAQGAAEVFLRKAAGKLIPSLSRPSVDWSVARARTALEGSLRRLGRARVDLYLLHEPDPALLNTDEWLRWLQSEADRVGHFGIAVDAQRLARFIPGDNPLAAIIQARDSIEGHEADLLAANARPLQLTYGYVRAAVRNGPADIPAIAAAALRRNTTGCVIVSTRKPARLEAFAMVADGDAKAADQRPAVIVATLSSDRDSIANNDHGDIVPRP